MTSQTSTAHSFTPSANGTEFNFSKPFLCMDVDGSNPAARNPSTKELFQKQNSLLEISLMYGNWINNYYYCGQKHCGQS